MHGLINSGFQKYVIDTFGDDIWEDICACAGLEFVNFEAMLPYDDIITEQIIDSVCEITTRKRDDVLEDFGTYIAYGKTHHTTRRLLRLGGHTYTDFLISLEDINDHIQITIPDLDLPLMQVEVLDTHEYLVRTEFNKIGYGAVFLGLLRAMADEYKVLVTINHENSNQDPIDLNYYRISIIQTEWCEETSSMVA